MLDGATVKTSKLTAGYQYSNMLFSLEKKCAKQKDEYTRGYPQNIILPVLDEHF